MEFVLQARYMKNTSPSTSAKPRTNKSFHKKSFTETEQMDGNDMNGLETYF